MAELKTKKNNASVKAFIMSQPDEQKRRDSLVLLKMFTEITGQKATMWGTSIIGFGQYHYESERSSQKGDWPLAGFSPRKENLTLYVMPSMLPKALFKNLGSHTTSKGCLYIKRLSDMNLPALKKIISTSYQFFKKKYAGK